MEAGLEVRVLHVAPQQVRDPGLSEVVALLWTCLFDICFVGAAGVFGLREFFH